MEINDNAVLDRLMLADVLTVDAEGIMRRDPKFRTYLVHHIEELEEQLAEVQKENKELVEMHRFMTLALGI